MPLPLIPPLPLRPAQSANRRLQRHPEVGRDRRAAVDADLVHQRLEQSLRAGRSAFWKETCDVELERIKVEISDYELRVLLQCIGQLFVAREQRRNFLSPRARTRSPHCDSGSVLAPKANR